MSKWTKEEVLREAAGLESHGYVTGPAMLREYAAHLAQPEWPSDEDAKKAARVYAKERGVPLDGVLVPMRDALQSVRPPVGVVSGGITNNVHGKVIELLIAGGFVTRGKVSEAMDIIALAASHHAPTASTKD